MPSSDSVLLNIHRSFDLRAALIPYRIFINGKYAASVKNGGSFTVEMPEAGCYLIEEGNSLFDACLLFGRKNAPVLTVHIMTRGGWSTPSYPVFTAPVSELGKAAFIPLAPAFAPICDAYADADKRNSLSEEQKLLLACYEFWISFSDDGSLSEIVCHENADKILSALRKIGAAHTTDFCENAIREVLGDVSLPIKDIDEYEEKLPLLDEYIHRGDADKEMNRIIDELRSCIAQVLLKAPQ